MSDDDGDSRRALANAIASLLVSSVSDQPTTVILLKFFYYFKIIKYFLV